VITVLFLECFVFSQDIISVMATVSVGPVFNVTGGQDIWKHRMGVSCEMTWGLFRVLWWGAFL
jgi:hypothetical protein